ncbi:hypothetical protein ANN_03349 [Periplaneta americana]|uniref:Uncharacterized protein n=1 Tax=Periplaneta americana TaxID=6978 RepID=A0ABQ8TYQ1_PERAM|nr:hypothetical protein ANN_03349 [Periplaneta americana]
MSPGSSTDSYPAFAHIGLRENPGKKPQPDTLPQLGIEPGLPGFAARRANRYFTGDNAGEMSPGSSTESYPAFARIGLRENPGKNLNQFLPSTSAVSGTRPASSYKVLEEGCPSSSRPALGPPACVGVPHGGYLCPSDELLPRHMSSPLPLYGCSTFPETLTFRQKQRLRVSEKKVLRKIFGDKRDKVTGEWRKLHNAGLHTLYSSPDIIRNIEFRRLRWAEHVACMGESRNAFRVLARRPEGKRPLGIPRCRWEDTIKMDLREVVYDDRDWINLVQDKDRWRAYVMAAMNLRFP